MVGDDQHLFRSSLGGLQEFYDPAEDRHYWWCHKCLTWVAVEDSDGYCKWQEPCHCGR